MSKPFIIQYDAGGGVLCISNEIEYLENERSYKNSDKEFIFLV